MMRSDPPGALPRVRGIALRVLAPVERFLAIEAASGLVLLLAAIVAMIWANSPLQESYFGLWHTRVGFHFGSWSFSRDLHFVINDGLMTVFFFVVGLEIRREMHGGELSEIRRATLPLMAALGGMLAPALAFALFNHGRSTSGAWGIPTATDIAFAVGTLALLGKRVAPALRVLLLALAVVDDIGAILVIAVFYSSGIDAIGVVVALLGVLAIVAMKKLGVRAPIAYVVPSVVIWSGAYVSGVHPTLAGVVIGMMTPVEAWYGPAGFLAETEAGVKELRDRSATPTENEMLPHLDALRTAQREAVSPVERLQHALHGWVAFGIMPLFALANAGVKLGGATMQGDGLFVFLGVTLGLLLGKPVGIVVASFIAVRVGIATLPRGMGFRHVTVVGMVAGIGFTMAIFIAQLALSNAAMLETAKLGVLCGSVLAALLGSLIGYVILSAQPLGLGALNHAEAEASTEI